jgi:hypothetical protein
LTIEDGTDILSRNVGNELPTYAVQDPRRKRALDTVTLYVRWEQNSPYEDKFDGSDDGEA